MLELAELAKLAELAERTCVQRVKLACQIAASRGYGGVEIYDYPGPDGVSDHVGARKISINWKSGAVKEMCWDDDKW